MRVWLLLLPALAYVALSVHASVAFASMNRPVASSVAFQSAGTSELQNQASSPLAPCCAEQQCTKLVTSGPLIPSAGELPSNPRHGAAASVTWHQTFVMMAPTLSMLARGPSSAQEIPVYLATARLRL